MAGQGTPATALLVKRGIAHRTHPYRVSPDAPNYGADSALDLPTSYVSTGRRGLQLELAAADLVASTEARTAPLQSH
ncbi:hypothetical protein ACLQ24_13480 [Micromonospora sp. DT4]|uniref:hypothetical protein n=1 Tax=Micromonospora sp. DT4 TaxID=3393438 RepID=UPI003CF0FCB7